MRKLILRQSSGGLGPPLEPLRLYEWALRDGHWRTRLPPRAARFPTAAAIRRGAHSGNDATTYISAPWSISGHLGASRHIGASWSISGHLGASRHIGASGSISGHLGASRHIGASGSISTLRVAADAVASATASRDFRTVDTASRRQPAAALVALIALITHHSSLIALIAVLGHRARHLPHPWGGPLVGSGPSVSRQHPRRTCGALLPAARRIGMPCEGMLAPTSSERTVFAIEAGGAAFETLRKESHGAGNTCRGGAVSHSSLPGSRVALPPRSSVCDLMHPH